MNIDNLPNVVDYDGDWDFDGAIGGEAAQRVGLKRKLLSLQDECRTKTRRVPMNSTEMVELPYELLQSKNASADAVPSCEAPALSEHETHASIAELDIAIAHIVELEAVKTRTVFWREELLEEIKQRHAEEIGVWKESSTENQDSSINDVLVPKAGSVKMPV